MIEKTVLDYLSVQLEAPVFMEVPSECPDAFVVVEKVGESVRDHVRMASIACKSYSLSSLYGAACLDGAVKEAMDRFDAPNIGACRMASDYNHTDTRTKRYRYQCVYDICYVK